MGQLEGSAVGLLTYKPADYAFKTMQALAKWTQQGLVADYIVGFAEKYMQCVNVNRAEAMF